jgi:hypothetical protein
MDTWLNKISTWTTEANALATGANANATNAAVAAAAALSSENEAAASEDVALAAANYKGDWTAKEYTVPASVSHLNRFWMATETCAAGDVPGTSTKWQEIKNPVIYPDPDWEKTITYSSGNVSTIVYAKGVYRYRKTLSYTSGNLTSVVYAYSSDSGSSYANLGTETLTYTSGNLTSTSWAEA